MHAPTELRWLYIDFNSYFASVEQQLNPALRGKPVIVVPTDTDATCAIAASYEAKALGIKTNTPVWEAKAKCPDIACVVAHHEHYVEYHHRIIHEINQHIPVTAVCSIDEVACRLMSNEIEPARIQAIAASIKRGLRANVGEYIRCSIGAASNRYLAKVATDMQKPDGLTLLMPDTALEKLATQALRDLPGIGKNMERRLLLKGIGTVEVLLALSPRRMRALWGNVGGERLWYLLRGYELPELPTTRRTIGHSHVLAPQIRGVNDARLVARRLLLKAASRLRRLGFKANALSFAARIEHGERLESTRHFPHASDSLTLVHVLDVLWRATIPQHNYVRIKKISVVLYGLCPETQLGRELFDKDYLYQQRADKLSQALDKINQRFGRDSICLGSLPQHSAGFSGTKVAFTRIPELEEFAE